MTRTEFLRHGGIKKLKLKFMINQKFNLNDFIEMKINNLHDSFGGENSVPSVPAGGCSCSTGSGSGDINNDGYTDTDTGDTWTYDKDGNISNQEFHGTVWGTANTQYSPLNTFINIR